MLSSRSQPSDVAHAGLRPQVRVLDWTPCGAVLEGFHLPAPAAARCLLRTSCFVLRVFSYSALMILRPVFWNLILNFGGRARARAAVIYMYVYIIITAC